MPVIIAIAGPSGSGKTVLSNLLRDEKNCTELVSMTTRDPRKGEINGKDYTFVNEETFKEYELSGSLIESVCYNNQYYGIPANEVEKADLLGSPSVVVVDPNGIENVKKYSEEKGWECITIFVNNPVDVLMERLLKRVDNDKSNLDPKKQDYMEKYEKVMHNFNKRVESMNFEQINWVLPAYNNKDSLYSIVIDKFNPENQENILNKVFEMIQFALNKEEPLKKNKKFGMR